MAMRRTLLQRPALRSRKYSIEKPGQKERIDAFFLSRLFRKLCLLSLYGNALAGFKHVLVAEEYIAIIGSCRNDNPDKGIVFYLYHFSVLPIRLMGQIG